MRPANAVRKLVPEQCRWMGLPTMKYYQVKDGEWRHFLRKEKVACCDCGLVHTYRYRTRDGYLQRQAVRDPKATWARRKRLGLKVTKRRT